MDAAAAAAAGDDEDGEDDDDDEAEAGWERNNCRCHRRWLLHVILLPEPGSHLDPLIRHLSGGEKGMCVGHSSSSSSWSYD